MFLNLVLFMLLQMRTVNNSHFCNNIAIDVACQSAISSNVDITFQNVMSQSPIFKQ